MKKTLFTITIALVPLCALASTSANEEALTVINKQHQTLAALPFDRGFPTAGSAKALQSELAFQRATQAYPIFTISPKIHHKTPNISSF